MTTAFFSFEGSQYSMELGRFRFFNRMGRLSEAIDNGEATPAGAKAKKANKATVEVLTSFRDEIRKILAKNPSMDRRSAALKADRENPGLRQREIESANKLDAMYRAEVEQSRQQKTSEARTAWAAAVAAERARGLPSDKAAVAANRKYPGLRSKCVAAAN